MMVRNSFPDTSNELLLQKVGSGVRLIRPELNIDKNSLIAPISDLMHLPFNVFFLDLEHRLRNINEIHANSFGHGSVKEALYKTARDTTTKNTFEIIIASNKEVTHYQRPKIFEADVELKNRKQFMAFAMKFPLYNDLNQVVGVFGFSSVIGKHPLENFISQISRLGLLSVATNTNHQNNIIAGVQFTDRQMQILRLLVRGQQSKEIAKNINLSYRTVQHYLENIKFKLNVFSKSELIDKVIDYI